MSAILLLLQDFVNNPLPGRLRHSEKLAYGFGLINVLFDQVEDVRHRLNRIDKVRRKQCHLLQFLSKSTTFNFIKIPAPVVQWERFIISDAGGSVTSRLQPQLLSWAVMV